MTIDVIAVSPKTKINQVATLLFENNLTGVPVVDNSNKVVGIVTEYDLMGPGIDFIRSPQEIKSSASAIKQQVDTLLAGTVDSIMTQTVETVTGDTDLATLTDLIISKRINPVPVVDDDNTLVGIISRSDLVKLLRETRIVE